MASPRPSLLLAAAALALFAGAVPRAAAFVGTCVYCGGGYRLSCYVGDQSPPGPCDWGVCTSNSGQVAQLPSCASIPNRSAVGSHNCAGLICPDWVVVDTPSGAVSMTISAVTPDAGWCPDMCTNSECNPGWGEVCNAAYARRLLANGRPVPHRARWAVTPTPDAEPIDDISAHLVPSATPDSA